jgi:hypothetical protein
MIGAPRPCGRVPRVARLLALAHHFDELLETHAVETQAEFAELAKLTPAHVTQIMNLLGLPGGPGRSPARGSHRPGRAQLTHPVRQVTGSLRE